MRHKIGGGLLNNKLHILTILPLTLLGGTVRPTRQATQMGEYTKCMDRKPHSHSHLEDRN